MKTITFFNHKGGVGKTTLVYHCAWMFAEQGHRVLAVDLDPQSNLSAMALPEERLEALWLDRYHLDTVYGAIAPLFNGTGDIYPAHIEPLTEGLGLLVGDLMLACIEDDLFAQWLRCLEGRERAFRATTAFWRVICEAAERHDADVVLIDVGPNLGAINRAALVATDHVVVPVAPNLFSLQGLKDLGPTLEQWRDTWQQALFYARDVLEDIPQGTMEPIGYVLVQQADKGREKWEKRLADTYREDVLGKFLKTTEDGPLCRVNHYPSLVQLAMEARKPMFDLTQADGAIGALQSNVQQCRADFERLADAIADRIYLKPAQRHVVRCT